MLQIKKRVPAFTLIEMTLVLFIISLLILIMVPNLANQKKNAQSIHHSAMKTVVDSQVQAYSSEHPKQKQITFADLKREGFLTSKQVNQAKDQGIEIK